MKMLLSPILIGAMTLCAVPAAAQHRGNHNAWNNNHRSHQRGSHHARWAHGHRFGPRYSYTSYNSLPRTYVRRYHLSPRYRYVYTDGYIYQVDPTSYAITRVIEALTR